MRQFAAVIEHCTETNLYIGYVPGFDGAHSQAETLDELHSNLQEVIEMLLEEGEPKLSTDLIGIQNIAIA
ncbi:type II toxin-antitoxin system HicB family antitoxin [Ectothiorhodospiraceae bacterium BW-2]|nr:type II toxin-antitoxin system HicB family antitoxin [Ectothiorhodospiraceae bacterium BW-2]